MQRPLPHSIAPSQSPLGESALDGLGNTPLLRLDRIAQPIPRLELLAKAEWFNPGGSVKDRAAANIIAQAERAGNSYPAKSCSIPPAGTLALPMP